MVYYKSVFMLCFMLYHVLRLLACITYFTCRHILYNTLATVPSDGTIDDEITSIVKN